MSCTRKVPAWRSTRPNENGKYPILFGGGHRGEGLFVPCQKCLHCRLARAADWGVRVEREASLYPESWFVTLTYDEENLPPLGHLVPEHAKQFVIDLRNRGYANLRTYGCAEYGTQSLRPHYHLCLLNLSLPKLHSYTPNLFKNSNNSHSYFTSPLLTDIWSKGSVLLAPLNFDTAAYTARYASKAFKQPLPPPFINAQTGEIIEPLPAQAVCVSRRPGIGHEFVHKFSDQLFRDGYVISSGRRLPLSKYFLTQLEKIDPERLEDLKSRRRILGLQHNDALNRAYAETMAKRITEKGLENSFGIHNPDDIREVIKLAQTNSLERTSV